MSNLLKQALSEQHQAVNNQITAFLNGQAPVTQDGLTSSSTSLYELLQNLAQLSELSAKKVAVKEKFLQNRPNQACLDMSDADRSSSTSNIAKKIARQWKTITSV